jgi:hypothetical protein
MVKLKGPRPLGRATALKRDLTTLSGERFRNVDVFIHNNARNTQNVDSIGVFHAIQRAGKSLDKSILELPIELLTEIVSGAIIYILLRAFCA